jgi:hypothetical protein
MLGLYPCHEPSDSPEELALDPGGKEEECQKKKVRNSRHGFSPWWPVLRSLDRIYPLDL